MPSIILGAQVDGGRLPRCVPQVFLDETQIRSRVAQSSQEPSLPEAPTCPVSARQVARCSVYLFEGLGRNSQFP
jgi:hypothetical protein